MLDINLEKEEKIRKQWLISFFITLAAVIIAPELGNASYSFFDWAKDALYFGITYYFAYKKRGTAWLAWSVVWCPLLFIFLAICTLFLIGDGIEPFFALITQLQSDPWQLFSYKINFVVGIYFWVTSWRLLEVNSKRKEMNKLKADNSENPPS